MPATSKQNISHRSTSEDKTIRSALASTKISHFTTMEALNSSEILGEIIPTYQNNNQQI